MIDFVSTETFHKTSKAFEQEVARHDTKKYEDWRRLRAAITREVGRYGRWNDQGEDCDFYHGDDWFSSLTDGFALRSAVPLARIRFGRLREVVATHSRHALLSIGGDLGTPLFGLSILVHPQVTLVTWDGMAAAQCRSQLLSFGYREEAPNQSSEPMPLKRHGSP